MFAARYAALRAAQTAKSDEGEAFDDHVFACVLAAALGEREESGAALTDALGLPRGELAALHEARFPLAAEPPPLEGAPDPRLFDEEELLRELLSGARADDDAACAWLVAIVARRAMRDDHLWQDLGLFNRAELSRLLARHFPALHAANADNMRWKKYFYRHLCELDGFSLCAAPHCSVCADFASCFGDEDGLSRLAMAGREAPM